MLNDLFSYIIKLYYIIFQSHILEQKYKKIIKIKII